ncbi:hypothetical protein BDQ12DRAFT_670718 [Crucibulum laeve]|uniref:Uncharacterized protein n=1 Tax=Crucibulum laeve TaxID=68775 RepID=A0A5C3LIB8_9AGAR|nr:hypothetical protein BDQ12DRAFT_670718 [Crucibulum laeve]
MFSVPQSGTQDGLVDRCILIHLPDPVKYVHVFFLAIYDLSFDDWMGKSEDCHSIIFPSSIDNSDTSPEADALLELAAVVSTTNTTWLLPVLLYNLGGFRLINMLGSHNWKSDTLDESLKRNIIVAYSAQLARIAIAEKVMMAAVPARDCTIPLSCSTHAMECAYIGDILVTKKRKLNPAPEYYEGICKKYSVREGVWMNMPTFYSLQAWKELQRIESAVKSI